MEYVYKALIILHLLGMAALIGAWLVSIKTPRIHRVMLDGALTQLVTGIAMVGLRESKAYHDPDALNMTAVGVKLLIALIVTVLVWINRKKTDSAPASTVHTIGALALVNVIIGVLWV